MSGAGNGSGSGNANGHASGGSYASGNGDGNGYANGNGYASGQPGAAATNGSGAYNSGQYGSSEYSSGEYRLRRVRSGQYGAGPFGGQTTADRPAGQYGTGSPPDLDTIQINRGFLSGTPRTGGYPQASPARTAGQPAAGNGSQRGRHSDEIPVVTGIPVSRDAVPPFDVFRSRGPR